MTCLNCEHAKFLRNLKGEVDFVCIKYDEIIYADDKCHHTKEYKREKKVIDVYMKYYKTKSIEEIAKKLKWDRQDLNYFVYSHYLPRQKYEREKLKNANI